MPIPLGVLLRVKVIVGVPEPRLAGPDRDVHGIARHVGLVAIVVDADDRIDFPIERRRRGVRAVACRDRRRERPALVGRCCPSCPKSGPSRRRSLRPSERNRRIGHVPAPSYRIAAEIETVSLVEIVLVGVSGGTIGETTHSKISTVRVGPIRRRKRHLAVAGYRRRARNHAGARRSSDIPLGNEAAE